MGEWGTLYGAAGIIAFNLLFFTLQISLFTRKKFHPKIFLTPLNISTLALIFMLIFHVHFPRPLQTVCSNIGGITTKFDLPAYNVSSDGTSSVRSEFKNGSVDLCGVSSSKSDKRICDSARYGTSSLCEGNASVYDFICCNNPIYHLAWTACIWRLNTMLIF